MKIRKQDEELLLYSQGQLAFLTSQRQRKKVVIWSRIILSIGFLVLWQMASDFEWIDDFYFSSPRAIGILFLQDLQDIALEVERLLGGQAGGVIAGLHQRLEQARVAAGILRGLA